jgi:hypothetical protein
MVCYVPAISTGLSSLLFLRCPLTVLMKQTRQAVCTFKQSILLRCLWCRILISLFLMWCLCTLADCDGAAVAQAIGTRRSIASSLFSFSPKKVLMSTSSLSTYKSQTRTDSTKLFRRNFKMEHCALKYINSCLNTNIYSCLDTSGGQSCNIY